MTVPDMIPLLGARRVKASKLDSTLIGKLTGGDPIEVLPIRDQFVDVATVFRSVSAQGVASDRVHATRYGGVLGRTDGEALPEPRALRRDVRCDIPNRLQLVRRLFVPDR